MSRMFVWAAIGVTAAWMLLATPSTSQAQGYGPGCGFGGGYDGYPGIGSGYGGGYGGGFNGRGGYGGVGIGGYQGGYGVGGLGYGGGGFGGGYGGGYGGYGRRAIVHPERLHWTPGRGLHTHGHIHVPHRGHYHTVPY